MLAFCSLAQQLGKGYGMVDDSLVKYDHIGMAKGEEKEKGMTFQARWADPYLESAGREKPKYRKGF